MSGSEPIAAAEVVVHTRLLAAEWHGFSRRWWRGIPRPRCRRASLRRAHRGYHAGYGWLGGHNGWHGGSWYPYYGWGFGSPYWRFGVKMEGNTRLADAALLYSRSFISLSQQTTTFSRSRNKFFLRVGPQLGERDHLSLRVAGCLRRGRAWLQHLHEA
jgi:hypothetical protein